jgi:hypothetical protein
MEIPITKFQYPNKLQSPKSKQNLGYWNLVIDYYLVIGA